MRWRRPCPHAVHRLTGEFCFMYLSLTPLACLDLGVGCGDVLAYKNNRIGRVRSSTFHFKSHIKDEFVNKEEYWWFYYGEIKRKSKNAKDMFWCFLMHSYILVILYFWSFYIPLQKKWCLLEESYFCLLYLWGFK